MAAQQLSARQEVLTAQLKIAETDLDVLVTKSNLIDGHSQRLCSSVCEGINRLKQALEGKEIQLCAAIRNHASTVKGNVDVVITAAESSIRKSIEVYNFWCSTIAVFVVCRGRVLTHASLRRGLQLWWYLSLMQVHLVSKLTIHVWSVMRGSVVVVFGCSCSCAYLTSGLLTGSTKSEMSLILICPIIAHFEFSMILLNVHCM